MQFTSDAEIRDTVRAFKEEIGCSLDQERQKLNQKVDSCLNPNVRDVSNSLDASYRLSSIIVLLRERFLNLVMQCLDIPKPNRNIYLKTVFHDPNFLRKIFPTTTTDSSIMCANGIVANFLADSVFDIMTEKLCSSLASRGEGSSSAVSSCSDIELLGIAGGTLGLCINKIKRSIRRTDPDTPSRIEKEKLLQIACACRMTAKEKMSILRLNHQRIRFLMYKDKGYLHIPKLEILPIAKGINPRTVR